MEELDKFIKAHLSLSAKRALSVRMYSCGIKTSDIRKILGVSQGFVSKWNLAYESEGVSILPSQYKGKSSFLSTEQRTEILEYLSKLSHCNLSDFCRYLEQEYGVVYQSKQSYYDLLSAGGFSWHKTQKSNPKKEESEVLVRREAIEKGELVVLMQDECHLIWGDACGYNWLRRNEKVAIPMTNFRYRQTYYGALNLWNGAFELYPHAKANGAETVDFLTKICAKYAKKRILMIWDGASYHRGELVKNFLAQINDRLNQKDWRLTLMNFAPNAPEQNPVEDIWLKGKNEIRRNFMSLDSFAKTKKVFFNALDGIKCTFNKTKWYYNF